MRFIKNKFFKKAAPLLLIPLVLVLAVTMLIPRATSAQLPLLNPADVRLAVQEMGMDSLATVILNEPAGLTIYVRNMRVGDPLPATPASNPPMPAPPASLVNFAADKNLSIPKAALLVLGKALFFDQQAGSDGQACASCHFHAGTDIRAANSLNPGTRNTNVDEASLYNATRSGGMGAPNYILVPGDFPFHEVADPLDTSYMNREVLFDTDDPVGSIGTFHATYAGSPAPDYSLPNATGTFDAALPASIDPVFSIGGKNTRSNGPRQAATMINAVFNFRQFWDGRADNNFNGLNGHGIKDLNAYQYWNSGSSLILDLVGGFAPGSLASQSVFPPNSVTSDEMAFAGRTMQDLGRKMLRITSTAATPPATIIPLGAQLVHPNDSVLGPFKNPGGTNGGRGINLSYLNLIQWAFLPTFWESTGPNDPITGLPTTLLTPGGFHLMEENFATFWGTSIQEFETTLRADQSPYDLFMAGNDNAFGAWDSTQAQTIMRGLLTYIHTESAVQQVNPLFNNINFGACQLCHSGPELTENTLVNVPAKLFVTTDMTVKMDHNRELAIVPPASNFDVGFSNVGTRPNREDIGIGGDGAPILPGVPLSITRGINMGQMWAILMLPAGIAFPAKPNLHRGSNTDGSFKIPHLRNVELMGPYFHHGGSLTLKQSVEFYARHGDFADVNDPDIDVGLAMVQNIGHEDADLIVSFLLSLTDERVRWEMAPFDHPQLFLPNGHPASGDHPVLGASYYPDNYIELPAIGASGRSIAQGPLPNFLGISSTPVDDPIAFGLPGYAPNDHFDP
jgi:cytochrome c peroxidase